MLYKFSNHIAGGLKNLKKEYGNSVKACDKRNMPSFKSDAVQFVTKLVENQGKVNATRLTREHHRSHVRGT